MEKPTIMDRMLAIRALFMQLTRTAGRNDKEYLVKQFRKDHSEMNDDLNYCFEILDGQHKIGFELTIYDGDKYAAAPLTGKLDRTIRDFCADLENMEDHTELSIYDINRQYCGFGWFLNPLFNRSWRLGIGKSQLDVDALTPMLAKKFDPDKKIPRGTYYLTEKLDGNRCLAFYNAPEDRWVFVSRSGKNLRVNFDMSDLPTNYVYDGEILSKAQIHDPSQEHFNALTGIVNSKNGDKSDLVYTIFDVVEDMPYRSRRLILNQLKMTSTNVHILKTLAVCSHHDLTNVVEHYLDKITSVGGEGVMINFGDASYQHKRTGDLLKVKKVYSMDMVVKEIVEGKDKYEGMVGAIRCLAVSEDCTFECMVGSGLSDEQRADWAAHPGHIIGKVVEVSYFSLSQSIITRDTRRWSLRFPRLRRVRDDKASTSVD